MPKLITIKNCNNSSMYYFKKKFCISDFTSMKIKLFAQSRYILYINSHYVAEGPCRGPAGTAYFDDIDVTKYLFMGENEIVVKVWHVIEARGFASVMKSIKPTLIFEGEISTKKGTDYLLSDSTWECAREVSMCFNSWGYQPHFEVKTFPETFTKEEVVEEKEYSFNTKNVSGETFNYFEPKPRPIPYIIPENKKELKIINIQKGYIDLDAGIYTTAKVNFLFDTNKKTQVKITYAECYFTDYDKKEKDIRDDITGEIKGFNDNITFEDKCEYSPFWFRAFRFIRLECDDIENIFKGATYQVCAYPLNIISGFKSSDQVYNKMYDVSVNTLNCCMHEIFVDCPYYEQQQYAMDTAIEAAASLCLSDDTRLIKKALIDMAASQMPSGLLMSAAPISYIHIIPGFSFFWIMNLYDYFNFTNDTQFVKSLMGCVDKIFTHFECNLNSRGLVGKSTYWDYVDWTDDWERGCPTTNMDDSLTLYNMYFVYAVNCACDMYVKLDMKEKADYLEKIKAKIITKLYAVCYDKEKQMFYDTEKVHSFSQHTIVWAILSEIVTGDKAKEMMSKLFDDSLTKCSFSMNYYLYLALKKKEMYDEMFSLLNKWQIMLEKHSTTWWEEPNKPRSECHAWSSAVPLCVFNNALLGVRYHSFDDEEIVIKPITASLSCASGKVPTPKGVVEVSWKNDDNFTIEINNPCMINLNVILPDGTNYKTKNKTITLQC